MSDDHASEPERAFDLPPLSASPDTPDLDDVIHFTPIGFDPSQLKPKPPIVPIKPQPMEPLPIESIDGREYLTDAEMEVVYFIERFHSTQGESPTSEQIKRRFNRISDNWLNAFNENPLVLKSMRIRGITYPNRGDLLSARQLAAVASYLAYTDKRSDAKKLADIGVTSREWAGWLQDETFAAYLRDRSERMLSNSIHEAHLGLIKGLRNGNTASIRTYYEMTGRYNPNEENAINVRLLLHQFIEVIQKHINDPLVLHRISTELINIASREAYLGGNGTMIQGRAIGR